MSVPPPFDELWFRLVTGAIIGLCLGSFITMLSYRLPKHLSIIAPPSQCPSCGNRLKVIDLIPVLSWLIMRGRCRFCRNPIGARYVVIEIATGTASMLAFGWLGYQPLLLAALATIIIFIASIVIIIEHKPYMGEPPKS